MKLFGTANACSRCLTIAATLAVLVLLPAPARAQSITAYAGLDLDGNPLLSASSSGLTMERFKAIRWRSCAADAAVCQPLNGTRPGLTVPGTVFEGYVTNNGAELTARTPAWGGTAQSAGVPVLAGEPRVGGRVHVVPTTWTGGWVAAPFTEGASRSGFAIAACRDTSGRECFVIDDSLSVLEGIEVQPRWAGWRLLAGEWRSSGGNPVSAIGWLLPVPMTLERLQGAQPAPHGTASSTAARLSALSAPVAADPSMAESRPAPAATVTLRKRALRGDKRISVGRVTCPVACRVSLRVSGGGRKSSLRAFRANRGITALKTPVRRGRLSVRVRVDGKLLARGIVRAP